MALFVGCNGNLDEDNCSHALVVPGRKLPGITLQPGQVIDQLIARGSYIQ